MTLMMPDSRNPMVRITAVIVLYNREPAQSETLLTLNKSYTAAQDRNISLDILLYDNTSGGQDPGVLPDHVEYIATPRNMGLAAAYNWAIERSTQLGSEWLLTLDQDTSLPEDFVLKMGILAAESAGTPMVAAIVPRITGGGRMLSPYRMIGGALVSWFPSGFHGISAHAVSALNSGALLRLSVLREVGGYSPWFWLDNSDAFLFQQLHRYGKRVLVAGEVLVSHDFSVLDMRNRVSTARYHNILLAESAFWDLEKNMVAGWERTARLLVRLAKQLLRKDPPQLRRVTVEFLKRRLLWSRRRRLQAWREETVQQFPELDRIPFRSASPLSTADGSAGQPRV